MWVTGCNKGPIAFVHMLNFLAYLKKKLGSFNLIMYADRMKEANSLLGMVKFAASRSGRKYVIGREGWKGLVVHKLMYDGQLY